MLWSKKSKLEEVKIRNPKHYSLHLECSSCPKLKTKIFRCSTHLKNSEPGFCRVLPKFYFLIFLNPIK